MMEAAIYARVSSEQQEERRTIESQVAELRAIAEKDGVRIVHEYRDDGVSGATLERPALDQLRDDASRQRFSRLYVLSPDRLARKYIYQAIVLEELARKSIEVVFRDRPVGDGPEDRLLLGIEGLIAEYERAKITERTRRGRLHRARQGEIVAGHAPFGYRYIRRKGQPARYQIHAEHAAIVRQIFDHYLKLGSSTAVALQLRAGLVPTASGTAEWSPSRVGKVLRNECYAGTSYYNKTQGKGAYRDRAEWIPVKVPRIVDQSAFDAVQDLMRNRGGGKRCREYVLSGLVVCAHCGCRYAGNRAEPKHSYYRCSNARERFPGPRTCFAKMVPAERLELAVTTALTDALISRELILLSVEERAAAVGTGDELQEQRRLTREIASLEQREQRLVDLYVDGGLAKRKYLERHTAIERRRDEARSRLQDLERAITPPDAQAIEQSIDYFAGIARTRVREFTPVELRQFLQRLVESVNYDWREQMAVVRARLPILRSGSTAEAPVSPFPGTKTPDRTDTVAFELKVSV